jgi:predicted Zn-ribbon and HTH transcriptional regulator
MKHCHCNQCEYDWDSRVENPKQCPQCKRYDWNDEKKA